MITISNSQAYGDDEGGAGRMHIQAAPARIGRFIWERRPSFIATGGKLKAAVGFELTGKRKSRR